MFKIYRLKIRGIEPFASPEELTFGPFFNLIRGGNGAGKTTVLESLALLGHCSVMEYSDEVTQYHQDDGYGCYVKYTIILGECTFAGDPDFADLAMDWNSLLGKRDYVELTVRIFHQDGKVQKDLKADLKDEDVLRNNWRITGRKKDVEFLKKLVAFSRPVQKMSEERHREELVKEVLKRHSVAGSQWDVEAVYKEIISAVGEAKALFQSAPRSEHLEAKIELPPFISYFNTDMYHYGLGIDIRESPKHLKEELVRLVKDRLSILDGLGTIMNFDLVQKFWDVTYEGERKEALDLIWFDEYDNAHIVIIDENNNTREFLSSGENQTLSLGLIFGALKPNHSVILLDEPDLHLSLPAALRMYNEVFKRSLLAGIQTIVVSHLPFIFPQALHEEMVLRDSASFTDFYRATRKSVREFDNIVGHGTNVIDGPIRCLTLYYFNKVLNNHKSKVEIFTQEKAAVEAGRYQNDEIDSILRQSKAAPPDLKSLRRYAWGLLKNGELKKSHNSKG